jgi:hypothetical protein
MKTKICGSALKSRWASAVGGVRLACIAIFGAFTLAIVPVETFGANTCAEIFVRSLDKNQFKITSPKIKEKIFDLLSAGPNRWIELQPVKGKYIFQRGLSGRGRSPNPFHEIFALMNGKVEVDLRTVSFVADANLSEAIARDINSGYSGPLSVRGRTDRFEVLDFLPASHVVTPGLQALLSDPQFAVGGSTKVGNRAGETQSLANYDLSSIEALGIFTPSRNFISPKIAGVFSAHKWAESLLKFYQIARYNNISISVDSRGAKFFKEIEEHFQNPSTNGTEAIFDLFDKYH